MNNPGLQHSLQKGTRGWRTNKYRRVADNMRKDKLWLGLSSSIAEAAQCTSTAASFHGELDINQIHKRMEKQWNAY